MPGQISIWFGWLKNVPEKSSFSAGMLPPLHPVLPQAIHETRLSLDIESHEQSHAFLPECTDQVPLQNHGEEPSRKGVSVIN